MRRRIVTRTTTPQQTTRSAASGVLAGAVATLPMTAVMLAAQRLGLLGQMPPDKITKALLDAIDTHLPKPARAVATAANHFAFGAAMAGIFGALGTALGAFRGRHPLVRGVAAGVAWGTIVWAASYTGWVPALGIMPPPSRDRPGRPLAMIAAHWVYGATLGGLVAVRELHDHPGRHHSTEK